MFHIVKAILLRLLRLYNFQMRGQYYDKWRKIKLHLLHLMTGIRSLVMHPFTSLSHLKQKVINDFNCTLELFLARFNSYHLYLL